MHRIKVYVDTSVFGGVHDEEFQEASKGFFELVQEGKFVILVSEITLEELEFAPDNVKSVIEGISALNKINVELTDEIKEVAAAYVDGGALGKAS